MKNSEEILQFYLDHRILLPEKNCPSCGSVVKLNKASMTFRCDKTSVKKKTTKGQRCRWYESGRKNSWLSGKHFDDKKLFAFVIFYLTMKPPRTAFLENFLKISRHTVVDWASFVREVLLFHCKELSVNKIGGRGRIVEIDEAKIGHWKYNRGRWIEGKWIFGGFERGRKLIFVVPVWNRSTATLLRIIRKRIRPGTTIMSDRWASYRVLGQMTQFEHLTVNHSINFVDPDTGTHTNNIERTWREVRANVPRYGPTSNHFSGYLAEFLFKRKYTDYSERIHEFYRSASMLYDVFKVE